MCPELLSDEHFPLDVRLRAQKLLEACDGESVGEDLKNKTVLLHIY